MAVSAIARRTPSHLSREILPGRIRFTTELAAMEDRSSTPKLNDAPFLAGHSTEQFLTMFGMLTGTASTGVALLREIDGKFKTPASENLVYQNFPAIVFGFPMMLLATLAPKKPLLTFGILVAFFVVMNVILFRKQIFMRKKK